MQFTPQETKMIRRLRKQQHSWRWVRWMLLSLGVILAGIYTYIAVLFSQHIDFEALKLEDVLIFAMVWPKFLMGVAFATACIVWPIVNWHGNSTRVLLLKLLDEHPPSEAQLPPGKTDSSPSEAH